MQALNARLSSAERLRITLSCCGTGSRWCSGELLALVDVARAGRERRPADDDRPASDVVDGRETPLFKKQIPARELLSMGCTRFRLSTWPPGTGWWPARRCSEGSGGPATGNVAGFTSAVVRSVVCTAGQSGSSRAGAGAAVTSKLHEPRDNLRAARHDLENGHNPAAVRALARSTNAANCRPVRYR